MSEERLYPTLVIRSQAEAIELLEKENQQLKENWNELKKWIGNRHEPKFFHQYDLIDKMQELEANNE